MFDIVLKQKKQRKKKENAHTSILVSCLPFKFFFNFSLSLSLSLLHFLCHSLSSISLSVCLSVYLSVYFSLSRHYSDTEKQFSEILRGHSRFSRHARTLQHSEAETPRSFEPERGKFLDQVYTRRKQKRTQESMVLLNENKRKQRRQRQPMKIQKSEGLLSTKRKPRKYEKKNKNKRYGR